MAAPDTSGRPAAQQASLHRAKQGSKRENGGVSKMGGWALPLTVQDLNQKCTIALPRDVATCCCCPLPLLLLLLLLLLPVATCLMR
jgi:hypothetical protein